VDDKEEVHSSGNKEEMAVDVEDSAHLDRGKQLPRSEVVAENLVAVVGKFLIPAVLKLNVVRS
jgi:hypothetical protein